MYEINEEKIQALGLRRTGERGRPKKGQWFINRDGDPELAIVDGLVTSSSGADQFDLLERDPAAGFLVLMLLCRQCGKRQVMTIPGWESKEQVLKVKCQDCSRLEGQAHASRTALTCRNLRTP